MITLYHGSGSLGFRVGSALLSDRDWTRLRNAACELLKRRGKSEAARLLDSCGLVLHEGENDFSDEFCVLFRSVSLDEYVEFDAYRRSHEHRTAIADIAKTITELGHYIRFVAVELDRDRDPGGVPAPRPTNTSESVESALYDAELLVSQGRPVSAADRAHTGLHGFLKGVCADAGITIEKKDPSLTDLMRDLRQRHPKLAGRTAHSEHTTRVLNSLATTCDALDRLRDRGSLAHPNEDLLDEAEAMLAINAARTILHYVHGRLES